VLYHADDAEGGVHALWMLSVVPQQNKEYHVDECWIMSPKYATQHMIDDGQQTQYLFHHTVVQQQDMCSASGACMNMVVTKIESEKD
jgi:NAD-dependent dihydropyrimidine dehydrogenase PreA subunit